MTFAAIFLWYVAAFYHDIVEVDEISFTMLIVQLKYIYWIGPVGAFQFLLTAIVLLVRFWREPLAADDEVAADAPYVLSAIEVALSGDNRADRAPTGAA